MRRASVISGNVIVVIVARFMRDVIVVIVRPKKPPLSRWRKVLAGAMSGQTVLFHYFSESNVVTESLAKLCHFAPMVYDTLHHHAGGPRGFKAKLHAVYPPH